MKKLTRIATPLIAVALMSGATLFANAQVKQDTPAQSSESRSWNTPPPGTEQAQAAYRDGVESAQLDMTAKRKVDAKSSHLYVHPPVKSAARDEYRSSFTAGYEAAVKHTSGGE
jgi:hypothetical protein